MNFSKRKVKERYFKIKSNKTRISHKFTLAIIRLLLLAVLFGIGGLGFAGYGLIHGLIDTAPSIESVDVMPTGYATKLCSTDGKVTQTLVGEDANREYVTLDKVPQLLQDAFVAIEDERFWTHKGVDLRGILRAAITGLSSGDFSQGASTLTQQLLKNQVFNGGQETTLVSKIKRKIQEQYLAIQLEDKLSKEEILEYYLNTINLGQNTLGVEAASKRYFGKSVTKLTLSEASVLAGITQNPSAYNPITHPDKNRRKRATVLAYMKEQGYIDAKAYEEALNDNVYKRIQLINKKTEEKREDSVNSYFTDAVIDQVLEDLKEELGYTETQAYNALYRGGLTIYTTQNRNMQKIVDRVINNPSFYPADSKYQLTYRLSILLKNGKEVHYNEKTMQKYFSQQGVPFQLYYTNKKSANKYIKQYKQAMLKKGSKITGEAKNFTIQPQTSFVLMDQSNGNVKALSGGRGTKTGNRTLNRAKDSLRQPGSTFKVLGAFLPAIDTSGMTLASVLDDSEYNYPGTKRAVKNWYSGYRGLSSIREAITNSMNIIAVKTLEQVTPKTGYDYLLNLGFTSLVENMTSEGKTYTDIALPMALGGLTKGVSNLELTTAFASIANNGMYNKARFYTKILDHDGNVLLEKKNSPKRVMKDSTAWLLTDAMKDVVQKGTGTMLAFQTVKMPVAGKTGTTTDNKDIWFVGYTPYLTAGIWGGDDQNEYLTNTTFHKVIWRTIMEKISKKQAQRAFEKPDSITSALICTKCGKLAIKDLCDQAVGGSCMKKEYFSLGNVPTESCDCHIQCRICKNSGLPANEHCPNTQIITKVYLQKDETGLTDDTPLLLPKNLVESSCPIHKN